MQPPAAPASLSDREDGLINHPARGAGISPSAAASDAPETPDLSFGAACADAQAFLYRLGAVRCRVDGPSIEILMAEGYEIASEPNLWGSVWMRKAQK